MIVILGADVWSCLCLLGILFLGFSFLSGFQGSEMPVCSLVGNSSGILIGVATKSSR